MRASIGRSLAPHRCAGTVLQTQTCTTYLHSRLSFRHARPAGDTVYRTRRAPVHEHSRHAYVRLRATRHPPPRRPSLTVCTPITQNERPGPAISPKPLQRYCRNTCSDIAEALAELESENLHLCGQSIVGHIGFAEQARLIRSHQKLRWRDSETVHCKPVNVSDQNLQPWPGTCHNQLWHGRTSWLHLTP